MGSNKSVKEIARDFLESLFKNINKPFCQYFADRLSVEDLKELRAEYAELLENNKARGIHFTACCKVSLEVIDAKLASLEK